MRTRKVIAIPLIGIMLVLGACSSTGSTSNTSTTSTPPATTPPAAGSGQQVTPTPTPPAGSAAAVTPTPTPPAGSAAAVTPTPAPPAGSAAAVTPPPTGPAKFVLSNVSTNPDIPEPNQLGTIICTITNAGGTEGKFTFTATINGQPYDLTQSALDNKNLTVDLTPGQSQDVYLNILEPEGTYTIQFGSTDVNQTVTYEWRER